MGDLHKIYEEYYNSTSPVSETTILECGSFMIVGRWYFANAPLFCDPSLNPCTGLQLDVDILPSLLI